jgi:hypothetical protein
VAGLGFGLSVVKALAEIHGGWVDLGSEADLRSTVAARLPSEPVVPGAPAVAVFAKERKLQDRNGPATTKRLDIG